MLSLSVPSVAALNGTSKTNKFQGFQSLEAVCSPFLTITELWEMTSVTKLLLIPGYLQLNEIEINMHLPPGMTNVVQCKVSPQVYRDMALTGKKFDPKLSL